MKKNKCYLNSAMKKQLTISVLGQHKDLPLSDLGDGVVGVVLVYDSPEKCPDGPLLEIGIKE